jgi:hypothetical protein
MLEIYMNLLSAFEFPLPCTNPHPPSFQKLSEDVIFHKNAANYTSLGVIKSIPPIPDNTNMCLKENNPPRSPELQDIMFYHAQ